MDGTDTPTTRFEAVLCSEHMQEWDLPQDQIDNGLSELEYPTA